MNLIKLVVIMVLSLCLYPMYSFGMEGDVFKCSIEKVYDLEDGMRSMGTNFIRDKEFVINKKTGNIVGEWINNSKSTKKTIAIDNNIKPSKFRVFSLYEKGGELVEINYTTILTREPNLPFSHVDKMMVYTGHCK